MTVSDSTARHYELRDPDVRLMLQVRDGSAGAFEELVRRYQTRLLTVMAHLVGNRHHAEDLVQEVFLRVYRSRQRYQAGAKFATWLFTIANNVANNARRSQNRRREINLSPPDKSGEAAQSMEQVALAASGAMPNRLADRAERARLVRAAVEQLGERQRMAMLLSKFEGMSYADISKTMGLSVPATKSLLSRARESLRILLEPYMEQGGDLPTSAAPTSDD